MASGPRPLWSEIFVLIPHENFKIKKTSPYWRTPGFTPIQSFEGYDYEIWKETKVYQLNLDITFQQNLNNAST